MGGKKIKYKEKILVIDDSRTLLAMVEAVLKGNGYEVVTALTGEEGVDKAKQGKFDLVLSDMNLPGIDGWEVCRRLKRNKSTLYVPIIMLTGVMTDTEHEIKAFGVGADDYVTKPCDMDVLVARINVAINRTSFKKQLGAILKLGFAKILSTVIATIVALGLVFWGTFQFIIKTSQLGRYAELRLGEVASRLTTLLMIEGVFFALIIALTILLFSKITRKRLSELEGLIEEMSGRKLDEIEKGSGKSG
ncbi:MAG: response regulator [Elusimicrobiota bacterium]